jgi:hypothetical protein
VSALGGLPLFTVLLPVHRPPDLLPFAIESVLAQRERRFELFVVCDGTPPETVRVAESYAARDPRVRVLAFPKGERHGERHRHTALEQASGELVAHLGDDDLWFPAYLGELSRLLEVVDFGNLLQAEAGPDGAVLVRPGDLADPRTRARMLDEAWNFFGPTFAGYRLEAYRRLPVGWSPAPTDLPTDLFMWRKLLRQPGLSYGTRFAIEGVKLAAVTRAEVPLTTRAEEARAMVEAVATPAGRRELRARGVASLHAELRAELDGVLTSHSWAVTKPLRAITDWGRARRARMR